MDLIQSSVLGLIQGLTEYLPISSTAHLRVLPALLGWPDPGAAYSAVVQLGTLLAVLVFFFRDLLTLFKAFVQGIRKGQPWAQAESRLAWLILLGTVPVGVVGLLFQEAIRTSLRSLWVVALALAGFALLLGLAESLGRRRQNMSQIGLKEGFLIGCAQALALIPGASRSGVTITAGLLLGLKRADAARYSFLLSVPAIFASGLFELFELAEVNPQGVPWLSVMIGTVVAAVSGYAAIAFLLRFLQRHSTWVFVCYRLLMAISLVLFLSSDLLVD
jgi:undecaprenyl-diphosphatase